MKRLKLNRERYGLTQSELARRLGTTQQTIARWETGKAEPSLAALRDLAICLATSVDDLLGRKSTLEHQTTNPVAWVSGDKSGYWGNVGMRLPHSDFSTWYPVTTSTMERVFAGLQDVEPDTWLSFQTLNNKMVICRPSRVQALTFLDEAEDEVEDDWEVGPDDVEGWPREIYECLEYLMAEGLVARDGEEEFSDRLIAGTKGLIREHQLDDRRVMEMCAKTRITYTDGTMRWLYASPERLAGALFDFDMGVEHMGSTMLHLDDEGGEHSVFVSLDLVARLEFPLLALKKGLEAQQSDDADDNVNVGAKTAKSSGRKSKRTA